NEFLHQLEILSQQPMLQFNPHARLFKYRLIAYLKLLEQRRTQIFVIFHDEFHYQQQVRAVSAPTQEIRELLNDALEQTRQIQQQIRQLQREIQNTENRGFLKRLFKKPENHELKINELKKNLTEVRDHRYLSMIAMQKHAVQESVILAAKTLIPVIDAKVRHCAVGTGENGVTRSPLELQVPQDRNSFNIGSTLEALTYECLLSAIRWGLLKTVSTVQRLCT